ncbi:MAG: hypothetical protein V1827_06390 [Candidatus Micrarchaeota archaeon]
MKISCSRPIEGRRVPLCRTDEAAISRVSTKDGRELVERLQQFSASTESQSTTSFELAYPDNHSVHICPRRSVYHVMKALALDAARSLFPDNFLHLHEIRFFREGDQRFSASYSDFIPDETGVMGRRKEAMDAYYRSDDHAVRLLIREGSERIERGLNPDLAPAIARTAEAGIRVPHPEANYHLHAGKTIFFEVGGIDIHPAARSARGSGNIEALGLLAMLYSSYLRVLADDALTSASVNPVLKPCYESFRDEGFGELKRVFHLIFMDSDRFDFLLQKGYDAIKLHFSMWMERASKIAQGSGLPKFPFALDAATSEDMDRILREQY